MREKLKTKTFKQERYQANHSHVISKDKLSAVRFQKCTESLPIIKQEQIAWNTAAKWQRIVSVKTELIEKQTEQACDWTERKATIKVVLKQNQYIWTEINVNKVVTCTRCGFF